MPILDCLTGMFCSTGTCTCLSNFVAIQGYCYLSKFAFTVLQYYNCFLQRRILVRAVANMPNNVVQSGQKAVARNPDANARKMSMESLTLCPRLVMVSFVLFIPEKMEIQSPSAHCQSTMTTFSPCLFLSSEMPP